MRLQHPGCSSIFPDVRPEANTSIRNHAGNILQSFSRFRWLFAMVLLLLLAVSVALRINLEQRDARELSSRQNLVILPRGEFLKPMVLGYAQLASDLIWLEFIQVLGSENVRQDDYEWIRHALDVVTTLDPLFVEAYDLGGVVLAELGKRVDWSNVLLEKGMTANPRAWRLPFLLGFNHFFHLQDYGAAAAYLSRAARLPGAPAYVPELAARLYVQADSPELALVFLETMQRESQNAAIVSALERRRKEVVIERDITLIEESLADHVAAYGALPLSLEQLVERGFLRSVPVEPFGGSYRLDSVSGLVHSTTHPQRLRMHGLKGAQQVAGTQRP